jgi:hypothetical protein
MRNLGLIGALLVALWPSPAQAQSDFLKSKVKDLIERSGVYVSASSRNSLDDDVRMGRSLGLGYGIAGRQKKGRKIPFSLGSYSGDLETAGGSEFGRFKATQIMSGIGYSWVHGKMTYGAQMGVGYSFNKVTLNDGISSAFGVDGPVAVDVSNSWVLRPQVKAEYFLTRKITLRSQLSYSYTDPDVVVRTGAQEISHEWRPHHVQLNLAVGFFPFRK